jgi:cytidylate kinase
VVFPEAELKVFLVASAEERGRRRLLDQGLEPTEEAVREEAERLSARDELDSSRAVAPLRRATDAIELDTTEMSSTEVLGRIVSLARAKESVFG